MNNIYIPTSSAEDWKAFLAEPDKQWKSEKSAKELAYCWERSNGFPTRIKRMMNKSPMSDLHNHQIVLAIPEFKVPLPGGNKASQNDIFVLSKSTDGSLFSIMIEGKVSESFGPTIEEWLKEASEGKQKRLEFLCQQLGIHSEVPKELRYQLFHRTVSAILTAQQFNTNKAIMLVHSFSKTAESLRDFSNFVHFLGQECGENELVKIENSNCELFIGWVSEPEFYAPKQNA
ncbi:MAG: hypothetical protein ABJR05_14480 [Balneola sp.]